MAPKPCPPPPHIHTHARTLARRASTFCPWPPNPEPPPPHPTPPHTHARTRAGPLPMASKPCHTPAGPQHSAYGPGLPPEGHHPRRPRYPVAASAGPRLLPGPATAVTRPAAHVRIQGSMHQDLTGAVLVCCCLAALPWVRVCVCVCVCMSVCLCLPACLSECVCVWHVCVRACGAGTRQHPCQLTASVMEAASVMGTVFKP